MGCCSSRISIHRMEPPFVFLLTLANKGIRRWEHPPCFIPWHLSASGEPSSERALVGAEYVSLFGWADPRVLIVGALGNASTASNSIPPRPSQAFLAAILAGRNLGALVIIKLRPGYNLVGIGPGAISSSSPCCEDSGDEELSVLPRHTKVVVTGNNRTKSVLVGLHGVVKKAVGLGGWHWLSVCTGPMEWYLRIKSVRSRDQNPGACRVKRVVGLVSFPLPFGNKVETFRVWDKSKVLTNGIEVKLQRNALSVIEAPTGHEEDDENECENFLSSSSELVSDFFQKPYKSKQRPHKQAASVTKGISKNNGTELQSAGSKSPSHGMLKVDLSKLETNALWRYWRHFNLVDAVPNPSKEQLVDIVQRHFMSQFQRALFALFSIPTLLRHMPMHYDYCNVLHSNLEVLREGLLCSALIQGQILVAYLSYVKLFV
eukprot:Gb_25353 [translate_table: standard]